MTTNKSIHFNNSEKMVPKKKFVIISDTHFSRYGGAFNLHAYNVGINKINQIEDVSL